MIDEEIFRTLCRSETGRLESEAFEIALKKNPESEFVTVEFDIGINNKKRFEMSRKEVERLAAIAKEERWPEDDLLENINPSLHFWAKLNRKKMCEYLQKGLHENSEYSYKTGNEKENVDIIWPTKPPDSVPVEIAKRYLSAYAQGEA